MSGSPSTPNRLRGEYDAVLAGTVHRFDTTLGSVAQIEDLCGARPVAGILQDAVLGRRAADQMALVAAALRAGGRSDAEAEAIAAGTTLPEAEAFLLALMEALGFRLAQAGEAEGAPPLDGLRDGGAGAPLRSDA